MIYMLLAERARKSSMTNYNTQGCCAAVVEVLSTIRPAIADPKVQAAARSYMCPALCRDSIE
jgi:hypothetical protein